MANALATAPKRPYHKHAVGWGTRIIHAEVYVDGLFKGHIREFQEASSDAQALQLLREAIAKRRGCHVDSVWLDLTTGIDFIAEEVVQEVRKAGFRSI